VRTWIRGDIVDEYAEDGEGVVLLADGQVVALSAVAWSVVTALSDGPQEELQLVRALVEQFGVPHDETGNDVSRELTAQTLEDLMRTGIVGERTRGEGPDEG
jgi:hypothetical protein